MATPADNQFVGRPGIIGRNVLFRVSAYRLRRASRPATWQRNNLLLGLTPAMFLGLTTRDPATFTKLVAVYRMIPPGNEPMVGKLMDLNVLAMLGGGEWTEDEVRHLVGLAGFRVSWIVPTDADVSLIEGSKPAASL
jgi:hypothetical protein